MMPLDSFGQTSAYQLSKVKGFWNDFKIGTIGAGYFPSYTVRVVEDKDEYELDMNNDFNTTAKTFTVRLTPSAFPDPGNAAKQNQARLQLCRFDALGKFYDSSIELNPGKNVIGLLVEGKIDEKWYWAGFNWVTVNRKEATSSSSSTTTSSLATTTTTTTDGGGNLDLTACTALDDLEVRAGEAKYYNNNTECWASIILKNNGMKAIHGGFYTDDSTINIIDPHEFGRDGWGFLYLDPGQELNTPSNHQVWGYQPQTDSHGNPLPIRTVKTSKITAVYSEDGCMWILNDDLFSDGVIDAPIRTRDVSGLDPCN